MTRMMYNYRLPADQWWPFAMACRRYYQAEHPVIGLLASVDAEKITTERFLAMMKLIKEQELTADLQLFYDGDTIVIRPLERGFFFMNSASRWREPFGLTEVFYDDRSDVPAEELPNREVWEWCHERIESGEYLLFTLLSEHDVETMLIEKITRDNTPSV